jgi:hypothetical protein
MEGAALRVGLPRAALRWRGRVGPSARFAALPNGAVWQSWRGNRRKAGSVSTPADVAAEYEPATKQKKGSVDGSPAEGLAARSLSFRDRSNFSNHAPGSRPYHVSAPSRTALKSATISNGLRCAPLVAPSTYPMTASDRPRLCLPVFRCRFDSNGRGGVRRQCGRSAWSNAACAAGPAFMPSCPLASFIAAPS